MRASNMPKRWVIALLAALAWVSVFALPAHATFAGDNGRIAFRRFLDEERSTGAVFTINPDGTDERQITDPPTGFVDRNPDVSPDGRTSRSSARANTTTRSSW